MWGMQEAGNELTLHRRGIWRRLYYRLQKNACYLWCAQICCAKIEPQCRSWRLVCCVFVLLMSALFGHMVKYCVAISHPWISCIGHLLFVCAADHSKSSSRKILNWIVLIGALTMHLEQTVGVKSTWQYRLRVNSRKWTILIDLWCATSIHIFW